MTQLIRTLARQLAGRPLLIPFPLLAGLLGCAYLFGGSQRTLSPSFATARYVGSFINPGAPMHVWGLVFLSGFVCVGSAVLLNDRHLIAGTLFLGAMLYSWWSLAFFISAFADPRASLSVWAVYGMVAFVHYAASWIVWTDPLERNAR